MINLPLSLVVNRAAIARVTGLKPTQIKEIERAGDRVHVTVKRPRKDAERITLTLKLLEAAFHQFRKEGGRTLVVLASRQQRDGRVIHVVEGSKAVEYLVEEDHSRLSCTCEDFQAHETLCKHGWAVLWALGVAETAEPLNELVRLRQQQRDIRNTPVVSRPRPQQVRGVSID